MRKFFIIFSFGFSFVHAIGSATWAAEDQKSKYGPDAIPLASSHEYFLKNPAPIFWKLIPYYLPQLTGSTCSVASVAMVVNAARAGTPLKASDKLANETDLLKKVKNTGWKKTLGFIGRGVTLDQLGPITEESLKAYGVTPQKLEVVHTEDDSAQTKAKLHQALLGIEKSADRLILANFVQGVYTGDADVGHIAPLAAYDSEKKRVLVLDPDREWYEPYWVSEETLLKGMMTLDKQSGHRRGYVVINLRERQ